MTTNKKLVRQYTNKELGHFIDLGSRKESGIPTETLALLREERDRRARKRERYVAKTTTN